MKTLKQLRLETGRKQEDVAEEAGIAREYLSRLENGKVRLSRDLAEVFAGIYKVSAAELMGFKVSEESRQLREDKEFLWGRYQEREAEHARELQEKQREIESLKELVKELRHRCEHDERVVMKLLEEKTGMRDS